MMFPLYSHDVPTISLWCSNYFLMMFPLFLMMFPLFSHDVPTISSWCSNYFLMMFQLFSHDVSNKDALSPNSYCKVQQVVEQCRVSRWIFDWTIQIVPFNWATVPRIFEARETRACEDFCLQCIYWSNCQYFLQVGNLFSPLYGQLWSVEARNPMGYRVLGQYHTLAPAYGEEDAFVLLTHQGESFFTNNKCNQDFAISKNLTMVELKSYASILNSLMVIKSSLI